MTNRLSKIALAALAAAALGLAACASQEEPAKQAMAAIEKTLADHGASVEKYLPERKAEIDARITALRESMTRKKFGDVVADAAAIKEDLRQAVADSQIARAEMRIEMENEWEELLKTIPEMIKAVDKKLASQGSRPPEGMEKDAWKMLTASYDATRDSWGVTAEQMAPANFEASVLAGREAKKTIAGVMQILGLEPAA
ncbi:MAG: hypothetical protein ACREVI_02815 [Steroidobacteraceae bacterium]